MENEEMSKADLIAMLVSIREVARTNGEIQTEKYIPWNILTRYLKK